MYKTGSRFISASFMLLWGLISMLVNPLNGQISSGTDRTGNQSAGIGIAVNRVHSIIVDDENTKWFSTDAGILSFDGKNWNLYADREGLPVRDLRSLIYVGDPEGPELWIASPQGATVASLPMEEKSAAITYNAENAPLSSSDVLGLASGENLIRWIGTAKGVSALNRNSWLSPDYELHYPESVFTLFPITSMATSPAGDSCYVGTAGGGVVRVYRDNLDGISGASVYAQWGPIDLPSDRILSIYIAPDGTKWFGTEAGISRHTGDNTLDNWTVFTAEDGLVDNVVQAICGDMNGNIWFGTPAGLSVFDGLSWISYTTDDGLASNNILSITSDKNGVVWIGTEAGISSYDNGKFSSY